MKKQSHKQELQQNIKKTKQKLQNLKQQLNPQLLDRIRKLQKQIQRLQIVNINESNKLQNQRLVKEFRQIQQSLRVNQVNEGQQIKLLMVEQVVEEYLQKDKSFVQKHQLSNEDQLRILKNITTKSFINQSTFSQPIEQKSQISPNSNHQQFTPQSYISEQQQKIILTIMQSQVYPMLNRYLTAKSTLLSKLIQLNPQKRHNNSLLVSHQRVMLKQHLDITRRVIEELERKVEDVEAQLDRDFVIVKSKWQESERQLRNLVYKIQPPK